MLKLFIIDDHDDTRELLAEWLRIDGYDVAEFPRAEEALAAARENPPAAVITDLMLEGMSGLDLVNAVREDPALAALPIIACTGRADQRQAAGFTKVLVKPIVPENLSAILRDILGS
jgi:CheY-like chemotaxis protein